MREESTDEVQRLHTQKVRKDLSRRARLEYRISRLEKIVELQNEIRSER